LKEKTKYVFEEEEVLQINVFTSFIYSFHGIKFQQESCTMSKMPTKPSKLFFAVAKQQQQKQQQRNSYNNSTTTVTVTTTTTTTITTAATTTVLQHINTIVNCYECVSRQLICLDIMQRRDELG
jgi:hypothetical protein